MHLGTVLIGGRVLKVLTHVIIKREKSRGVTYIKKCIKLSLFTEISITEKSKEISKKL